MSDACGRWVGVVLSVLLMGGNAQSSPSSVRLTVPFYPDKTDQCGPSTLAGVLSFWGKPTDPVALRKEMYLVKLHGTLPLDLVTAAETHGLETEMVRGDLALLHQELAAGRPVLVMLNVGYSFMPIDHYVIVTGFDDAQQGVWMHSAGSKNEFISYKSFMKAWEKTDNWALRAWVP